MKDCMRLQKWSNYIFFNNKLFERDVKEPNPTPLVVYCHNFHVTFHCLHCFHFIFSDLWLTLV